MYILGLKKMYDGFVCINNLKFKSLSSNNQLSIELLSLVHIMTKLIYRNCVNNLVVETSNLFHLTFVYLSGWCSNKTAMFVSPQ